MKLNTRVFALYKEKYKSLPGLARAMEISTGQIYKVKQGKRDIHQKFIIGATKAFPKYNLDDLFYVDSKGQPGSNICPEAVRMTTASNRNEFGKMLKQRRLIIPLTLRELAAKSGVSASYIGRVERGERFPSGHILRKIAKPLGLDVSLLMTMAGYLSSEPASETSEEYRIYRQLDPYVAKVLSEEPVHLQRTMVTLFIMLKQAIGESLLRKQA